MRTALFAAIAAASILSSTSFIYADTSHGADGANGLDGTISSPDGEDGANGSDATAGGIDAVATGGNGGNGGYSYFYLGYPFTAGSGGNGGKATASASESAKAYGGTGGNAGAGGDSPSSGGGGGSAHATVSTSGDGTLLAVGGSGGTDTLTDYPSATGGAGGNACGSISAEGSSSDLALSISLAAGGGGWGNNGGPGGREGLTSAINAVALGGNLEINIDEQAGWGGNCMAGIAGNGYDGGNGFGDYGVGSVSSPGGTIAVSRNVYGGWAGNSYGGGSLATEGTPGIAGKANSYLDVASDNYETSLSVTTSATGGMGGHAPNAASPGGDASSQATAYTSEIAATTATATAQGGNGGSPGWFYGEDNVGTVTGAAGHGGNASAIATSTGTTAYATASATGGDGGAFYAAQPGTGGNAFAEANAISISGSIADAKATATAGAGGIGAGTYAPSGAATVWVYASSFGIAAGSYQSGSYSGSITLEATVNPNLSSGTMGGGTVVINSEEEGALPAFDQGPIPIRADDLTTATLTQSGGSVIATESVTINSGGTYLISGGTLSTPSLINNGSFNISGGTINASITNNTATTMSGGTFGSGYTLSNSGTFNLSGGTISSGGTITNSGTFILSGGTLNSSVVNDGTLKISGTSTNVSTSSPPSGSIFTNDATGTVTKTGGGTSHMYLPSIWNGGTISGALDLVGNATLTSGSTLHTATSAALTVDGSLTTTGAATLSVGLNGSPVFNGNLGSNLILATLSGFATTLTFGADQTIGTTHLSNQTDIEASGHTISVGSYSDSYANVNGGTLAVTGTFAINASSGFANEGAGTFVVNGPHSYSGGSFTGYVSIDGSMRLNADIGTTSVSSSPNVSTGKFGSLYIGAKQHFNDLNVGQASTISLDSGGKSIFASTVEIGDSMSTIDLSDGGMAAGSITDPVFGFSLHDMIGDHTIMSSAATADTELGYATASEVGRSEFYGESVDSDTTLIMYTYAGDANLDGSVTTADEDIVEANMGMTGADWADGDFNFDGTVDSADLAIVEANLGDSGLGDSEGAALPDLSVVPEPGWIAGVLLSIGTLTQRRRRS